MQKKVLIVLILSILISSFTSINLIDNLQGNAKVINYTGVVRGASQRLVKQELSGIENNSLVMQLDEIIEELQAGEGDIGLVRLDSDQYQSLLQELKTDWDRIKQEIKTVRAGGDSKKLYTYSEEFFNLANDAVQIAEVTTEQNVFEAQMFLIVLNGVFSILAILF
ncbi:type IV pili methyl-accepting chemotaxis transducer N-terminal domain-containing protein [uncultured Robinsoniella sp.]|uniref:type IV pili methyl-accepting chemotaxis transducer N-terminal domain-containing protein n=1 Tax=uncultured Robinsoniella sp. TaxID=904190 RepID=UPI00374ECC21